MKKLLYSAFFISITLSAQDKVINNQMIDPTKSESARKYYNEGVNYSIANDYQNAIESYKKALQEDENFVDALDNLGLAYRKNGNLSEAEKYYLKSIAINENNLNSLMNLAVVYGINKNFEKAFSLYKKVIQIEPKNAEGYYGACQTEVNAHKEKIAIPYCLKAKEIYENSSNNSYVGDVAYLLSIAYYNSQDKTNAKKYLILAKNYNVQVDAQLEQALKNN